MCFSSIRIGLYNPVKIFFAEKIGMIKGLPRHDRSSYSHKEFGPRQRLSAGGCCPVAWPNLHSLLNILQPGRGSVESERNIFIRILAGLTTGSVAVMAAQPTDVVKIRMQADSSQGSMRRYRSSFQAYHNLATTEGYKGLWKGTIPNLARTSIINAGELVCYDYVKEFLIRNTLFSDNIFCHFTSGFVAGFCATVVASPVDVVKTRIMNSEPGYYSSIFNCTATMYQENGIKAFYKG
ncbi:hypothetical protein LAZ67_X003070 [Cordylochernes scorpioides]|uniref:Uncoupling protein 3 n=1 Tax=Cordylochernes scorpioides TaxID=51811 RepID=A0ABY6LW03_9ARAC|nr:hypothetical protein LAZ67_X003070 [Cordylochernes scorpioides]